MTNYQDKIRQAKIATAKKLKEKEKAPEVTKSDIGELYKQLDQMYGQVSTALNKVEERALASDTASKQALTILNNNIVDLMTKLTSGMKVVNLEDIDNIKISNIGDIKIPEPAKLPKTFSISNLDDLAKSGDIQKVSDNLADIANQLGSLEPLKPGQEPSDFVPFRRVVMSGKRLQFDDSSWGGASGGGTSGIDISTLATHAKQDEIIAALGGGSLVPEAHDEIVLTYVPSGNGVGEIATAVYKLDSATVATLTLSYNGDNKLSGVVRT